MLRLEIVIHSEQNIDSNGGKVYVSILMAKNYEKSGIKTSLMLGGNISLTILAHFQEKLGFEISTMLLSDPIVFIMK